VFAGLCGPERYGVKDHRLHRVVSDECISVLKECAHSIRLF
jgi:hypothetical protein